MKSERHTTLTWTLITLIVFLLAACSSSPNPARTTPKPVPPAPTVETAKPKVDKPAQAVEETARQARKDQEAAQAAAAKDEATDKDAAALLEDAFTAYEEVQAAIERQDMERALIKLDEAYGLLLKMSVPADSPLLQ
ncbi:MAG: hypothetical protein ACXWHI_03090, partial [Candidatus Aminicenantales bacterium]